MQGTEAGGRGSRGQRGGLGGGVAGEGLKTAEVVTNPLGCFGETMEGE